MVHLIACTPAGYRSQKIQYYQIKGVHTPLGVLVLILYALINWNPDPPHAEKRWGDWTWYPHKCNKPPPLWGMFNW